MDVYRVELRDEYDANFHELVPRFMRYEVWHDEAGRWHRENGPAIIARDLTTDRVAFQAWYIRGELHRDSGPAVIYSECEDDSQLQWYRHGKLHREGAPADIIQNTFPTGLVNSIERWYKDGRLHRIGGPATIVISQEGIIEHEEWAIEGQQSRIDGPSELERDGITGIVTEERWMRDGQHHRLEGPAYIRRDPAGEIIEQVFCRDGKRLSSDRAPTPNLG